MLGSTVMKIHVFHLHRKSHPLICACQSKGDADNIAFRRYHIFVAGYAIFTAKFSDSTNLIWMQTNLNCSWRFRWTNSYSNFGRILQIESKHFKLNSEKPVRHCLIYRNCESTMVIMVFFLAATEWKLSWYFFRIMHRCFRKKLQTSTIIMNNYPTLLT